MTENLAPTRRILVVDDELNIRKLLGNLLRKMPSYEVKLAEDGQVALDYLQEVDFAVDLIITDMQMPRLKGEDLIREVVSVTADIPIMVVTANKNSDSVLRCLELGACEYIIKPIKTSDFLATVRRAIDRSNRFVGKDDEFTVKQEMAGWVELTAPTDFEYIERFRKFTSLIGGIPLDDAAREDIHVAFDELGQNAVEWGNQGDRKKRIKLSYCVFDDRIVFKIVDEGEGFDTTALRDPSVDPLAHIMARMSEGKRAGGYGVFLARKLMDDTTFNESGNTVLMTKFFQKKP